MNRYFKILLSALLILGSQAAQADILDSCNKSAQWVGAKFNQNSALIMPISAIASAVTAALAVKEIQYEPYALAAMTSALLFSKATMATADKIVEKLTGNKGYGWKAILGLCGLAGSGFLTAKAIAFINNPYTTSQASKYALPAIIGCSLGVLSSLYYAACNADNYADDGVQESK